MDTKKKISSLNSRHKNLTLKKNKSDTGFKPKKLNRSSDVIILDESFSKFRLDVPKNFQSKPMTYSPIVVNDSLTSDDDLPKITLPQKTPSNSGNVSFIASKNTPSPVKGNQPSNIGWSPAQHIITADPKNNQIPSTPKDTLNKSQEQCTIKTVEQSQKKILNELYGESWKSIPKLFKTISHRYDNFDGITKKLFSDDEKENIRHVIKRDKEIYLTSSEVKRKEDHFGTEKKCKKKLYTEKVASTPEVPKQKIRIVNSTTKKVKIKKGMSVTEIVEVMKSDASQKCEAADLLLNKIENDILTNTEKHFESAKPSKEVGILTKKGKDIESIKKLKDVEDYTSKEKSVEIDRWLKDVDVLAKEKNVESNKNNKNVDVLTKQVQNVAITPKNGVKRLSFMGSLADNVPSWRCHPEAFQYRDNFKSLREQLSRRLYQEFNRDVFGDAMDADMLILWDTKLRSTAGTTTNSLIKNARGDRIRSSKIKLSSKVLDTPQRLRDTLVHEMCHAATWLLDAEMRAGHGPLWKKWATRALRVFPELGEISRCHDMEIHFKYSYQCVKCGYTIQRHSKSIDITKKACGYCRGMFQIVVNRKNKDGVVVATPARKATNGFALFVKENYASVKDSTKTHAQVMKLLGEQYSAMKSKLVD